ncbi:MAG: PKD domain-containing protein [Pseudomonadota bacterium]
MSTILGGGPSVPRNIFGALLVVALIGIFTAHEALADAAGRSGRSGATASRCTSCHTAGAVVPTVAFGGSASLAAGTTGTYTFTITGGPAVNAGFDVAASGGVLAVPTGVTGIKILTREVVQSSATAFTASGVTYTFDWTAPAIAGTYTLYGAGLSGNGDGKDGAGDGTAMTTFSVTVTAGGVTPVTNPVARITAPTAGVAGTAVTFSAMSSTAPAGRTLSSYAWNFGDNSFGAGVSTTHSFLAGSYTVTLTVTDSSGATGSATAPLVVAPTGTSVLTANAGGPYAGALNVPVQFDGSGSSAPGGSIATYAWDFGDSSTAGTGVNPTHTYTTVGRYTVTVTVTDNTNTTATATTMANIAPTTRPPGSGGISAATGLPRIGERRYDRYCADCHGVGGLGVAIDGTATSGPAITGVTADTIAFEITEVPEMNTPELNALSSDDIRLISAFLQGAQLYIDNCESCHGVGGVGIAGTGSNILGASAREIASAIEDITEMQTPELQALTRRERSLIAFFLPRKSRTDSLSADSLADSGADYPDILANDGGTSTLPKATQSGAFDGLALSALGIWALRRRRKQ